ncbi:hypothetical protein [Tabrizicola sp. BL-A-41-H6]|uniref:hypothetical protein n=1 Tax=Tabrizicola sp. BL-A-41-H6 TaxID=3421107 RepID=UPI003D678F50
MGNRGRLHDAAGRIVRRWQGKAWITCTLREKPGRVSPGVMPPNGYTRLFFHDEAVASAAGHRPCAECRRAAYDDFRHAWAQAFGQRDRAVAMDAVLHAARIDSATRGQHRHVAALGDLPTGAFVLWQAQPHLVSKAGLLPYRPEGYGPAVQEPDAEGVVLTPTPVLALMRAGWQPAHSAAEDRPNW